MVSPTELFGLYLVKVQLLQLFRPLALKVLTKGEKH